MKKIAIFILVLGIAISYSCEKNEKVQTTISGQLLTNGTTDPIRISQELTKPQVALFHSAGGGFQSGGSWDEIMVIDVDDNANYTMEVEIYENDEYYLGFYNLDETYYYDISSSASSWYYVKFYPVTPGAFNSINLYGNAKSWIRPRFINTNPDLNNVDVFDVIGGDVGPFSSDYFLVDISLIQHFYPIKGQVDTLAPWIHSTWGGEYSYNIHKPGKAHKVEGKLTRNGVTTDVEIQYFVPPFDTSIVVIEY